MNDFSYAEMTTRNIGFVTDAEQETLRHARVAILGVGGMGGAALACLVRSGIGHFIIADIDTFEVSNLNRQIFCTLDSVGKRKAEATRDAISRINPECTVDVRGAEWVQQVDSIIDSVDVVINGCDDVRATLKLMRASRGKKPVIDAFASTLPNVYVAKPSDLRPEEVFSYPSVGLAIDGLTPEQVALCARREIEWVMAHSSSRDHVVMEVALALVAGKRKRFSFAPMVWMTGCLMAYETVRWLLGKPGGPGVGGAFHNPWAHVVEQPPEGPLGRAKQWMLGKALDMMMRGRKP